MHSTAQFSTAAYRMALEPVCSKKQKKKILTSYSFAE